MTLSDTPLVVSSVMTLLSATPLAVAAAVSLSADVGEGQLCSPCVNLGTFRGSMSLAESELLGTAEEDPDECLLLIWLLMFCLKVARIS